METVSDLIDEIKAARGGTLEGDHLEARAARWLDRYRIGVPALIRRNSLLQRQVSEVEAKTQSLIDDLSKARTEGAVYTYGAVQVKLRALLVGLDDMKAMARRG